VFAVGDWRLATGHWQLVTGTWHLATCNWLYPNFGKSSPNYVFQYYIAMLNINIICKFTCHYKDDYLSFEDTSRQLPTASLNQLLATKRQ